MAVGSGELPELTPVDGIRVGTAKAGIKKPDRRDLVIFELAEGTRCAAVFTRNRFCAAPVQIARRNLKQAAPRYLLVNTGNANAGTGTPGLNAALSCCDSLARLTGSEADAVLPFSTGVIGETLPVQRIREGLPAALNALTEDGWRDAAHGIMTTDTRPKGASRQLSIGGVPVTITGIAKGAGMIRPDMATMLAFVATDASIAQPLLEEALRRATDVSFNRITIDGDTSTNDACVLMATGRAGNPEITANDGEFQEFVEALTEVCQQLAQAIVRDGEGATRFIAIEVSEAGSPEEAARVGYTVAHSPLVKTAFFAADPNWGRILAAVGRAGIDDLDVEGVRIYLDDVCLAEQGGLSPSYTEDAGRARMEQDEVTVRVMLGRGDGRATVWTCDLSYDYVRINAEYRT